MIFTTVCFYSGILSNFNNVPIRIIIFVFKYKKLFRLINYNTDITQILTVFNYTDNNYSADNDLKNIHPFQILRNCFNKSTTIRYNNDKL